jgi:hypothetical protein
MQTLAEYFARTDTPMPQSPTALVMVKVLAKFPDMTFDDARTRANELLQVAAKRWKYSTPHVMSAEQQQQDKERFAAFNRSRLVQPSFLDPQN